MMLSRLSCLITLGLAVAGVVPAWAQSVPVPPPLLPSLNERNAFFVQQQNMNVRQMWLDSEHLGQAMFTHPAANVLLQSTHLYGPYFDDEQNILKLGVSGQLGIFQTALSFSQTRAKFAYSSAQRGHLSESKENAVAWHVRYQLPNDRFSVIYEGSFTQSKNTIDQELEAQQWKKVQYTSHQLSSALVLSTLLHHGSTGQFVMYGGYQLQHQALPDVRVESEGLLAFLQMKQRQVQQRLLAGVGYEYMPSVFHQKLLLGIDYHVAYQVDKPLSLDTFYNDVDEVSHRQTFTHTEGNLLQQVRVRLEYKSDRWGFNAQLTAVSQAFWQYGWQAGMGVYF